MTEEDTKIEFGNGETTEVEPKPTPFEKIDEATGAKLIEDVPGCVRSIRDMTKIDEAIGALKRATEDCRHVQPGEVHSRDSAALSAITEVVRCMDDLAERAARAEQKINDAADLRLAHARAVDKAVASINKEADRLTHTRNKLDQVDGNLAQLDGDVSESAVLLDKRLEAIELQQEKANENRADIVGGIVKRNKRIADLSVHVDEMLVAWSESAGKLDAAIRGLSTRVDEVVRTSVTGDDAISRIVRHGHRVVSEDEVPVNRCPPPPAKSKLDLLREAIEALAASRESLKSDQVAYSAISDSIKSLCRLHGIEQMMPKP